MLLLKRIILGGQIKDAKMSSFSSAFLTLIKHQFPLYFLYELLMSLRSVFRTQCFNVRAILQLLGREVTNGAFL